MATTKTETSHKASHRTKENSIEIRTWVVPKDNQTINTIQVFVQ